MSQLELWLTQYETDVRFPDVSGMEHLDMLLTRSHIAAVKDDLTQEQVSRLQSADQFLLRFADQFYHAISAVADLSEWRQNANASPEEWWWYLDVLVSVPQYAPAGRS